MARPKREKIPDLIYYHQKDPDSNLSSCITITAIDSNQIDLRIGQDGADMMIRISRDELKEMTRALNADCARRASVA